MEESPALILEAQGTTGGPVVKTFASDAEVPLAAWVQTLIGAEVGATLTVLQSGDPDVIFTNHACCKNYATTLSHTAQAHLR